MLVARVVKIATLLKKTKCTFLSKRDTPIGELKIEEVKIIAKIEVPDTSFNRGQKVRHQNSKTYEDSERCHTNAKY